MKNKYYNNWSLTKDQLIVEIVKDFLKTIKTYLNKNANKHTK